ncbi:uncharacterized protein LOC123321708 [Coccinella septempunctata]|uniref:uncharacterized protein LOC123321708 n=1 Tax=Coccinella septempunctata TaxID=41139 RepID=UPI001D094B2E|nr:uncharacterized protein LOC123321708 [Coccinella septempunctata]
MDSRRENYHLRSVRKNMEKDQLQDDITENARALSPAVRTERKENGKQENQEHGAVPKVKESDSRTPKQVKYSHHSKRRMFNLENQHEKDKSRMFDMFISKIVNDTVRMTLNNVQVDQARSGDQENDYFMQDVPGVDLINTDNLDTENLANNIRGHARVQSGSRIQGVSERNINVKSNLSSNFNLPQCLPGLNVQTAHHSGQQQISNLTMNDNLFGLGDLSKLVPDFDGESHVQAPEFLQFLENGINVNAISFNNIRIFLCKSFKIKKKIHDHTYVLVSPKTGEERGIFHSSHLKTYAVPTYAAEN